MGYFILGVLVGLYIYHGIGIANEVVDRGHYGYPSLEYWLWYTAAAVLWLPIVILVVILEALGILHSP